MADRSTSTVDAVVVGAGFAGMYMICRLRELGLDFRVFEAGGDVGGTWYWNRYPGARCDVPSIEYSYSFDKELEQQWDWQEAMAAQPEILAYANHVADRHELRAHIQFDTRVTAMTYRETDGTWLVETDRGDTLISRFCIMATGCLSVPNFPQIPGAGRFGGEVYHTGVWPHTPVDFRGKRVGIIGTGSSGVQAIPVIAETAEQLLVFQRTPVYTVPAGNRPLADDERRAVKANYDALRAQQRASHVGIVTLDYSVIGRAPDNRNILDLTPAQRREELRNNGLTALLGYADVRTDAEANQVACELYREYLDQIIVDPATAEGLKPRSYPLGCKRQVIDTDYYAAFNRDNVMLVDLRSNALREITDSGIRTDEACYPLDMIIYATGFDAMTGALNRIDIRGRDGLPLKDKWADGPCTYLGLQTVGFPNLFTITGPGSPSVLSNMLVSIEQHVDWIAHCLGYMHERQIHSMEPQQAAEDAWVAHVNEVARGTMFTSPSCNSWYLGSNVPGKPRVFMPYIGGVAAYRQKCDEVAAGGYHGFKLI